MAENKESLNMIDEFNASLRELFENKDFEGLLSCVREFKEENYYIFLTKHDALNNFVYSDINDEQLFWLRGQVKQVKSAFKELDYKNKSTLGGVEGYDEARKRRGDCCFLELFANERVLKELIIDFNQELENGNVGSFIKVVRDVEFDEEDFQSLKALCSDIIKGDYRKQYKTHKEFKDGRAVSAISDILVSVKQENEAMAEGQACREFLKQEAKNHDFDIILDFSKKLLKEKDKNLALAEYNALKDSIYYDLDGEQFNWLRNELKQIRKNFKDLKSEQRSGEGFVKGLTRASNKVADCWLVDLFVSERLFKDIATSVNVGQVDPAQIESVVQNLELDSEEIKNLKELCVDIKQGLSTNRVEFANPEFARDVFDAVSSLNTMGFDDVPSA